MSGFIVHRHPKIHKEPVPLTELQHESTFIHVLRGSVLLAALIAIPGMAVCWNLIPKAFVQQEETEDVSPEMSDLLRQDLSEISANTESMASFESLQKTSPNIFRGSVTDPFAPVVEPLQPISSETARIKRMGGMVDDGENRLIPNAFPQENAVWASQTAEPTLKVAKQVETADSRRSFPVLENRLKQLDAKYYRLEKWGNRGDLFRFSCYVSASGTQHSQESFQKHFQAIDSDELRVMENVIAQIEQWKNTGSRATP